MEHQKKAITLCTMLYNVLEPFGFFPALTGGSLYKEGQRKDIDVVIYKHRQRKPDLNWEELRPVLSSIGIIIKEGTGFVTKAQWGDTDIDFLFPENEDMDNDEYLQWLEARERETNTPQVLIPIPIGGK